MKFVTARLLWLAAKFHYILKETNSATYCLRRKNRFPVVGAMVTPFVPLLLEIG
jgi:hypothetical protein